MKNIMEKYCQTNKNSTRFWHIFIQETLNWFGKKNENSHNNNRIHFLVMFLFFRPPFNPFRKLMVVIMGSYSYVTSFLGLLLLPSFLSVELQWNLTSHSHFMLYDFHIFLGTKNKIWIEFGTQNSVETRSLLVFSELCVITLKWN